MTVNYWKAAKGAWDLFVIYCTYLGGKQVGERIYDWGARHRTRITSERPRR